MKSMLSFYGLTGLGGIMLVGMLSVSAAQAMPPVPAAKPNLGNSASIGTLEVSPEAKSNLAPNASAPSSSVIVLPEPTDDFSFLERALNNLAGNPGRTIQPALFETRPNKAPGFIRTNL